MRVCVQMHFLVDVLAHTPFNRMHACSKYSFFVPSPSLAHCCSFWTLLQCLWPSSLSFESGMCLHSHAACRSFESCCYVFDLPIVSLSAFLVEVYQREKKLVAVSEDCDNALSNCFALCKCDSCVIGGKSWITGRARTLKRKSECHILCVLV